MYILFTALLTFDISPTVGDVLEGDNQTTTCTVSIKPVATDVSWTKSSNGGFETIDRTAVPEKYSCHKRLYKIRYWYLCL